jgi:hypothetical protein
VRACTRIVTFTTHIIRVRPWSSVSTRAPTNARREDRVSRAKQDGITRRSCSAFELLLHARARNRNNNKSLRRSRTTNGPRAVVVVGNRWNEKTKRHHYTANNVRGGDVPVHAHVTLFPVRTVVFLLIFFFFNLRFFSSSVSP